MLERSKPLQIYMKPGIKEDDLMLRVWEACRRHDRPQDVFRSMLRAGLMAMLESGEMPEAVIEDCALDSILERRRRRSRKAPEQQAAPQPLAYPPYGYPVHVPQHVMPPQPHQAPWSPPDPVREVPPLREQPPVRHQEEGRPAARRQEPEMRKPEPPEAAAPETDGQKTKKRIGNLM